MGEYFSSLGHKPLWKRQLKILWQRLPTCSPAEPFPFPPSTFASFPCTWRRHVTGFGPMDNGQDWKHTTSSPGPLNISTWFFRSYLHLSFSWMQKIQQRIPVPSGVVKPQQEKSQDSWRNTCKSFSKTLA